MQKKKSESISVSNMGDLRMKAKFFTGKYKHKVMVVDYASSRNVFIIQSTGEEIPTDQGTILLYGEDTRIVYDKTGQTYLQELDHGMWVTPIQVDFPDTWEPESKHGRIVLEHTAEEGFMSLLKDCGFAGFTG